MAQWVMQMPIECEELGSLKIAFSRNLIYLSSFSSISFIVNKSTILKEFQKYVFVFETFGDIFRDTPSP